MGCEDAANGGPSNIMLTSNCRPVSASWQLGSAPCTRLTSRTRRSRRRSSESQNKSITSISTREVLEISTRGEFLNMGIDDKKKQEGKMSFFKPFLFADTKDEALMIIGTIAAMANGFSMPLMTFDFGELINTFILANKANVVHLVSKLYLGANIWRSHRDLMADGTRLKEIQESINKLKVAMVHLEERTAISNKSIVDMQQQINMLASSFGDINSATPHRATSSTHSDIGGIHSGSVLLNFLTYDGEDPSDWLFSVEQFFLYHQNSPAERLLIVSFHLQGPALHWYKLLESNQAITSWEVFFPSPHPLVWSYRI
ncbi:putative ABC transporter type 1, transmembrane domain superfamily [Dioscorea sansibarensis]